MPTQRFGLSFVWFEFWIRSYGFPPGRPSRWNMPHNTSAAYPGCLGSVWMSLLRSCHRLSSCNPLSSHRSCVPPNLLKTGCGKVTYRTLYHITYTLSSLSINFCRYIIAFFLCTVQLVVEISKSLLRHSCRKRLGGLRHRSQ